MIGTGNGMIIFLMLVIIGRFSAVNCEFTIRPPEEVFFAFKVREVKLKKMHVE